MPPSNKVLKFDLTLLTGNLERNFKRCTVGLMKGWRDFGNQMKKSNSFLEAGDAIYAFGKKGVESITALFHPYEALVGKVVAVGYAVKKACENFEQFEKAGLKASNAFKSGGVVKDFDKFKTMIQNQTAGGMGNVTEAMGALGSVRKANPALNSGEFSAIAELSTGAAAFNGEEYADAFERLGDILGSDAVSLDKLTSAGINFTFNEWQQVKAMNNRMMMHERNRIIIEKMKQTYKDAEKAEANTLSGMYRRIGNMLENLKVRLGEAIAPLAKPFFQLAVLIMNVAEGFIKPFVGIAKVIGAVFSPLTKLLTNCTGLVKIIGTLLGTIVLVMLPLWIKHQTAILLLWIKQQAMILLNAKSSNTFLANFLRYMAQIVTVQGVAIKQNLFGMMQMGAVGVKSALVGIFTQLKLIGTTTIANIKIANAWLLAQLAIMKKIVWEKTKAGAMNLWTGIKALPRQISRGVTSAGKGIASGWTRLSGGKGILGAMGNIGTGMLAGGKGFLSLIASFGKSLVGLVRFAGPLALVAAAITAVAGFFKGYVKGFMDSFNKASGSSKSFMDILKQVGGIIMKIVGIIMAPFKWLFNIFAKLGETVGWLGGKIASYLLPALETIVDFFENLVTKIEDIFAEGYFKFWEAFGFDMSKQRQEYEDSKKKDDKKDDKGFMPADIDFSSSFEGAASMTQRIQTALVSKNSPQAKMVDYLHDIRDYMKGMNDAQNKQVEAQKEDNALMKEQNKALGNMNMGLA